MFDILPALSNDHLYMENEFAFLVRSVKDQIGREIEFALFGVSTRKSFQAFKGENTHALLKKTGESWKLLVSPDDMVCACRWAEYNAPKSLFDYTDYCR